LKFKLTHGDFLCSVFQTAKLISNQMQEHKEQVPPDPGYIAIVTIVVATLLVLALTIVSIQQFSRRCHP
jgi:hypothetical protein